MDELFKLILVDENYKLLAHHNALTFLCSSVSNKRALELAKLVTVAMLVNDDPASVLSTINSIDSEGWIVKAVTRGFALN